MKYLNLVAQAEWARTGGKDGPRVAAKEWNLRAKGRNKLAFRSAAAPLPRRVQTRVGGQPSSQALGRGTTPTVSLKGRSRPLQDTSPQRPSGSHWSWHELPSNRRPGWHSTAHWSS